MSYLNKSTLSAIAVTNELVLAKGPSIKRVGKNDDDSVKSNRRVTYLCLRSLHQLDYQCRGGGDPENERHRRICVWGIELKKRRAETWSKHQLCVKGVLLGLSSQSRL